jgi:hypothetical protein
LKDLHDLGLKVTLNLHPADGVWPHEEQYREFARRQRVSPGQPIRFDCTNPAFMRDYFEVLHHPLEAIGVDFWWIDWQQGTGDMVDPLVVLNHQHFADIGRDRSKRPLILSRWCGLGGHRYPIGFSGDTTVEWISLQFQPYFTATSANVGFGFWSHDIGGHFGGHESGELYVRWLQFGALSPILRIHSNNNLFHSRLPWTFGPDADVYGCAALRLHTALVPLMYSLGYRNHRDGIQPVRPLYYICPEIGDAYGCPTEYLLGDDIIVAPFITPIDKVTGLASAPVWLPQDRWFDLQTGREYAGGWHLVTGNLSRMPIFVRAGGFVPTEVENVLNVDVFPGGGRRFELFEDDGISSEARYHITTFVSSFAAGRMSIGIQSSGDREFAARRVILRVNNVVADCEVGVAFAELLARRATTSCIELDVRIVDYPATVTLTHPQLVRDVPVDLFGIIRASALNSSVKSHVYQALRHANQDSLPAVIAGLESVPAAVKTLLYGELCDFGFYRFTQSMGKDSFVIWNTRADPAFQWVCLETHDGHTRATGGQVPTSRIWNMTDIETKRQEFCEEQFTQRLRIEVTVSGFSEFSLTFDDT